jgi:hypothetical protein
VQLYPPWFRHDLTFYSKTKVRVFLEVIILEMFRNVELMHLWKLQKKL